MDLDRYVTDELAEELALGHRPSTHEQHGNDGSYPGDAYVEVATDAVRAGTLSVTIGGVATEVVTVSAATQAPAPGIIVIHENKGLVPYIANTARRFAASGFVAAAPDLLAGQGGTAAFGAAADATEALKNRDPLAMIADLRRTVDGLAADPRVDAERLAVVGFCFGGGLAWRLLAADARLCAGVVFYGPPPPEDELAAIGAPVLAIYGETDQRITSTLESTAESMREHGHPFEVLVVDGAGHGFHNDTNPDRYNAEAAETAWAHALGFLGRTLDHPGEG